MSIIGLSEKSVSDSSAVQDDIFDDGCLVAVWDECERGNWLGDYQIRLLADCN